MDEKLTRTYQITSDEMLKEYRRNAEFRKHLEMGTLIYVEDKLVLNDPLFVVYTDGQPVLTEFANKHLSACALNFNITQIKFPFEKTPSVVDTPNLPKIPPNKNFDPSSSAEAKERYDNILAVQAAFWNDFLIEMPPALTCWQMMGHFIEKYSITKPGFCAKTKLRPHYYDSAIGTKTNSDKPSKLAVITFSAGYDLPYSIVLKLMTAAEYSFSLAVKDDNWYSLMLCTMAGTSMKAKNDWLKERGVKHLLGVPENEEEYHENNADE